MRQREPWMYLMIGIQIGLVIGYSLAMVSIVILVWRMKA